LHWSENTWAGRKHLPLIKRLVFMTDAVADPSIVNAHDVRQTKQHLVVFAYIAAIGLGPSL
jgi:hypothetical protein